MNTGIPRATKSAGAARAMSDAATTALDFTVGGRFVLTFTRIIALGVPDALRPL
jgi:hypothetical protein